MKGIREYEICLEYCLNNTIQLPIGTQRDYSILQAVQKCVCDCVFPVSVSVSAQCHCCCALFPVDMCACPTPRLLHYSVQDGTSVTGRVLSLPFSAGLRPLAFSPSEDVMRCGNI